MGKNSTYLCFYKLLELRVALAFLQLAAENDASSSCITVAAEPYIKLNKRVIIKMKVKIPACDLCNTFNPLFLQRN